MIIHIMGLDKFIQPFIDFTNKNCNKQNHNYYVIYKDDNLYTLDISTSNLYEIKNYFSNTIKLLISLYKADKIFVHALFSKVIILLLFFQPWLLKKTYWIMWGGDFYFPEQKSWIKKMVIKRVAHFVTYIKGDFELVQKWYGANGKYHQCFMYPSNLYTEYFIPKIESNTINIQVGNSADPTNNHFFIIDNLKQYKDSNINIFVPLSYSGNTEYVESVITYGKEVFGDKFVPMIDFLPFNKYLEFLGKIDIALFAHNRQQAMGNTITLLGLGKKVYMRSNITPWNLFKDIDVKVFDISNIDLDFINETEKLKNIVHIKEYFSERKLIKQMKEMFEG